MFTAAHFGWQFVGYWLVVLMIAGAWRPTGAAQNAYFYVAIGFMVMWSLLRRRLLARSRQDSTHSVDADDPDA